MIFECFFAINVINGACLSICYGKLCHSWGFGLLYIFQAVFCTHDHGGGLRIYCRVCVCVCVLCDSKIRVVQSWLYTGVNSLKLG